MIDLSILDEGNEVFIENSSGFLESSTNIFIFKTLLFEGIGFTTTLSGSFINNSLDLFSTDHFSFSGSFLLVSFRLKCVKNSLKIG